jgi:2-hydroxy-3-oxopropionate reductase
MNIGFVGLGIMGSPMAANLLKAGHTVTGYDVSAERLEQLAGLGGKAATGVVDAVAGADVVITMLPDSAAVEDVVVGSDGVLAGASAGDLLIDMSTIHPTVSIDVAKAGAERGVNVLDAPVSGGDVGAREGALSIMVGGDADALARARPALEALGTRITHVGDSGAGQVVKACNQIVVGLTLEALGEALVLGSKAGVDPRAIVEALGGGLAASRVLEVRGGKLLARDFEPGFKLDLHAKDLAIVLETARELGLPLPGTALVAELFEAERGRGRGDADNSTVVRALEALAGHEIPRVP